MNSGNAIEVRDVKKHFKIYMDKGRTIKERTLFAGRRKYEVREVLKGISFSVKKGEAIGLIGKNGCGKSTALKLLTRIMYPDSGTIEIKGRVSSLIELGAGFHPDMSGRENIYINASIFGLTRKEIDARLDDIIAFSELEDYIDNPVRTYSSGMYMRLAFSVAINVNADVLLIDEILAVGDANFQSKCFNKLFEIKREGTTIVIVSHSLGQIEQICERTIWIQDGVIKREGVPREVHPEYMDYMGRMREEIAEKEAVRQQEKEDQRLEQEELQNKESTGTSSREEQPESETEEKASVSNENTSDAGVDTQNESPEVSDEDTQAVQDSQNKLRWGNQKAKLKNIYMTDAQGKRKNVFRCEDSIRLIAEYEVSETIRDAVFGFGIFRVDGLNCYGSNTRIDRFDKYDLTGKGTVQVSLDDVMLMPGAYTLDFCIECGQGEPIDYWREAERFEIYGTSDDVGVCKIKHSWEF